MRTDRPRHPGPHPWLQHVVVAQCPGLAGEFAPVPGGHPRVAGHPVHGPREVLEEVSAVVVGSTLLLAEGQGCKAGKAQSEPLPSLCPPSPCTVPPRPPAGTCAVHSLPWKVPEGSSPRPPLQGHSVPLTPPPAAVPQASPEPVGQSWMLQERKRVRRPSQYWPPFRGTGRVQSREENWTPPPQLREQPPHGPQGPQPPACGTCRVDGGVNTCSPGLRARPLPQTPAYRGPGLSP